MKEFSLIKIYLLIISIVWLIWAITWYGNFGYQLIIHNIVTPEEYVQWSYDNYQFTQCKDPTVIANKETGVISTNPTTKEKTPAEIKTCQEEAKSNMLARRNLDYKNSIVGWIVWWTLFLLLFISHFPVFYKKYKQESH